jgi:hypothetical protein
LDLFYIHLKYRKYRNNFQKFGGPKRKTTFFYLELLLVCRELDGGRETGVQGADGPVAWGTAEWCGRTVRARAKLRRRQTAARGTVDGELGSEESVRERGRARGRESGKGLNLL